MVDDLDGEEELDDRAREIAAGGDADINSTGVADLYLQNDQHIWRQMVIRGRRVRGNGW
jgi:hypothetical protein